VGTAVLGFQGIARANQIGSVPSELSLAWVLLSGLLFIIILVWSNRGHFLSLDTRLESPSFFQRYKEDFKKQAVTALISSLIGGLIVYLLGHYLKK
jgi:hypothetical protein